MYKYGKRGMEQKKGPKKKKRKTDTHIAIDTAHEIKQNDDQYFEVPSISPHIDYLRRLIDKPSTPILIEGIVGSGKTTVVKYLAREKKQRLIKIQMNEQSDARTLIGTYCCTSVPGRFVWRPGCLTTATKEGCWLLLEDIDQAPVDLASLLLPLFETGRLPAGLNGTSSDPAPAHPQFRIFATRRLLQSVDGLHPSGTGSQLLERAWHVVRLPGFSDQCVQEIVTQLYPALHAICEPVILSLWRSVRKQQSRVDSTRSTSARDLFKLCRRLAGRASGMDDGWILRQGELMFLEAFDCFAASQPHEETRREVAQELGALASMNDVRVNALLESRNPDLYETPGSVEVGRCTIKKRSGSQHVPLVEAIDDTMDKSQKRYPFALTPPARRLLEQLANGVFHNEPLLLVGETGCGKTACVQRLSSALGRKLQVINMNQQSDTADLLGGYKPVELQHVVRPFKDAFLEVFTQTFNTDGRNSTFIGYVQDCFRRRRWKDLIALFKRPMSSALNRIQKGSLLDEHLKSAWTTLCDQLEELEATVRAGESTLAFAFVEGSLVHALRVGEWVLLDEINLAPPEMLECLSGLLEDERGSVTLTERGDSAPVFRHPDFRLFACMNPATDVGKRDLPTGLRSRFTELFVDEPVSTSDLTPLVVHYLRELCLNREQIGSIVEFYQHVRQNVGRLSDGSGHQPHFSLRTLCRALHTSTASGQFRAGPQRSLYEGFCYGFVTPLSSDCRDTMEKLVREKVVKIRGSEAMVVGQLKKGLKSPGSGWTEVEGYWIPSGPNTPSTDHTRYVMTKAVRRNLKDLTRVVSIGRMPVLLEGETSVGKTSLIRYLAGLVGQTCLRVNNHEHTDVQEYIGCYAVSETDGRLVFREGVLVEAMRHGHWIILDELNLAPTDILEALNRVLDDNRELYIPETQETVRAHPNFLLFATQNPAGGRYGGRKVLSRALRNRFVELYLDPLPGEDLRQILCQRCHIPASRAAKLVEAMQQLQVRRRESSLFHGKESYITLRDLFRWAERYRLADEWHVTKGAKYFDWDQYLVEQGYLLLAGRVRRSNEREEVREVLSSIFKREVDEENLFSLHEKTSPCAKDILSELCGLKAKSHPGFEHLVWTRDLRRLAVLVGNAIKYEEPVLLVGETGCGKTSLCQLVAAVANRSLLSLNCHLHSEAADFIGGLRPSRSRKAGSDDVGPLFEWVDGPLVNAMRDGNFILVDEISLADDSVLERLNSVLEPERSLLVAERAGGADEVIKAAPEFRLLATMNPGGDFGKKELSPALRNRFTELWCPTTEGEDDLAKIAEENLRIMEEGELRQSVSRCMVETMKKVRRSGRETSIRDLLAWVKFVNDTQTKLQVRSSLLHGAHMVFLDARPDRDIEDFLRERYKALCNGELAMEEEVPLPIRDEKNSVFGAAPFFIPLGHMESAGDQKFAFDAPTTRINAFRILRALQVQKPLLLEGSPGVGKTSLVAAIARQAGVPVVRINLSEQTDTADLFGCDLPVEGGEGGTFQWKDGPLLKALKEGAWILLDEMNLASQAVLEALNACLDHRGELFIPDLNTTFRVRPHVTRLFACQNPAREGGGRKGLPKSFLNRFTRVAMASLTEEDQEIAVSRQFPELPMSLVRVLVRFNETVQREVLEERRFGQHGSPWEFNLRDVCRWAQLIVKYRDCKGEFQPAKFVHIIYSARLRNEGDQRAIIQLWRQSESEKEFPIHVSAPRWYLSKDQLTIGRFSLPRCHSPMCVEDCGDKLMLNRMLKPLEAMVAALSMRWFVILTGPPSSGKSSLVSTLATLTGVRLRRLAVHPSTDTSELLGSFEQGEEGGRFNWVDSPLVCALKEGDWVLIDNVNLCSPSVLDRLNGLLEPGGVLTMGERGLDAEGNVPEVSPHPDFRLILTLNPLRGGEISRAMRNRGLEVSLLTRDWETEKSDMAAILRAAGVTEGWATLFNLHSRLSASVPSARHLNVTTVVQMAREVGEDGRQAVLRAAAKRAYVDREWSDDARQKLEETLDEYLKAEFETDGSEEDDLEEEEQERRALINVREWSRECDSCRVRMDLQFVSEAWQQEKRRYQSREDQLASILARIYTDRCSAREARLRVKVLRNTSNLSSPSLMEATRKLLGGTAAQDEDSGMFDQRWLNGESDGTSGDSGNKRILRGCLLSLVRAMETKFENVVEPSDFRTAVPLQLASLPEETRARLESEFGVLLALPTLVQLFLSILWDLPAPDVPSSFTSLLALLSRLLPLFLLISRPTGVSSDEFYRRLSFLLTRFSSRLLSVVPSPLLSRIVEVKIRQLGRKMPVKIRKMLSLDTLAEFGLDWRTVRKLREHECCPKAPMGEMKTVEVSFWEAGEWKRLEDDVDGVELSRAELWPLNAAVMRIAWEVGEEQTQVMRFGKQLMLNCERLLDLKEEDGGKWREEVEAERFFFYCGQRSVADALRLVVGKLRRREADPLWAKREEEEQARMTQPSLEMLRIGSSLTSTLLDSIFVDGSLVDDVFARETLDSLELKRGLLSEAHSHIQHLSPIMGKRTVIEIESQHLMNVSLDVLSHLSTICRLPNVENEGGVSDCLSLLVNEVLQHASLVHERLSFVSDKVVSLAHKLKDEIIKGCSSLLTIGRVLLALGRLVETLYLPRETLDPQMVLRLETEGLKEELSRLEMEVKLRQSYNRVTCGQSEGIHPYEKALEARFEKLTDKVKELESRIAFQRDELKFSALRAKCHGLHNSLEDNVEGLSRVEVKIEEVMNSKESPHSLRLWLDQWYIRLMAFQRRTSHSFADFPDIAQPFLFGICQMMRGLRLIHASLPEKSEKERARTLVSQLLHFPSHGPSSSLLALVDEMSDPTLLRWLQDCKIRVGDVLLLSLRLLRLHASLDLSHQFTETRRRQAMVKKVMEQVQAIWRADEERKRRREEEEGSLYRIKNHDLSGEDEDAVTKAVRKNFPDYREHFDDIVETEDNRNCPQSSSIDLRSDVRDLISSTEMSQLHEEVRFVMRMQQDKETRETLILDVMKRSCILGATLTRTLELPFNLDDDRRNLAVHLTLLSHLLNTSLSGPASLISRPFNVYTDPAPGEVVRARSVLQALSTQVSQLQEEYPEHAGLVTLLKLVGRLRTQLAVGKEPLMKFVTGCELLLRSVDEWERNAAAFVSLMEPREELLRTVTEWRKLELRCWTSSLDSRLTSLRSDAAAKWWPHLVALMTNDEESEGSMREALVQFIEGASLGDFSVRLQLLQDVRSLVTEEANQRFLTHVTDFYGQFTSATDKRLLSVRQPMEKEIKDFAKLVRWGDRGFWALRASVDRCHKTVYRQVRLWDSAIRESASSLLTLDPDESAKSQIESPLPIEATEKGEETKNINVEGHLGRVESLRKRLEGHCKRLDESCKVGEEAKRLIEDVDEGVKEADALRRLQPTETKDLEAWRRSAGHMQQRKRQALTTYFKAFKEMGLSYRFGLASKETLTHETVEILARLPVYENAARPERQASMRRRLSRSVARHSQLTRALAKPAADLGPDNVHRCEGFVAHLFAMLKTQYGNLAAWQKEVDDVRQLMERLKRVTDEETLWQPDIRGDGLDVVKASVAEMLVDSELVLNQWQALLLSGALSSCCDNENLSLPLPDRCLPEEIRRDGWTEFSTRLKTDVDSQMEKLEIIRRGLSEFDIVCTPRDVHTVSTAIQLSSSVSRLAESVSTTLGSRLGVPTSLWRLHERLQPQGDRLTRWISSLLLVEDAEKDEEKTVAAVNAALETVLLSQQRLSRAVQSNGSATCHILASSASNLRAASLLPLLKKDLDAVERFLVSSLCLRRLRLVSTAMPIWRRHLRAVEALMTQAEQATSALFRLHAVTAAVFTRLCSQGFCMPEEPKEEGKEGEEEQKEGEGCGMGEGKGRDDVSKEIEGEDQLEGMKNQEEEEEDGDGELEDEEAGVEMSNDFEGKMQEADQKEEENSDEEESEDEEMDEKMGDLENEEPEKVDREMWASEDEEDKDGEEGREKPPDRGPGVKDNDKEQELVGKDEQEKSNQEQLQTEIPEQQSLEEDDEQPRQEEDDKNEKEEAPEVDMDLDLPPDVKLDDAEKPDEEDENDDTKSDEQETGEEEKDEGNDEEESPMEVEEDAPEGETNEDEEEEDGQETGIRPAEMDEDDDDGEEGETVAPISSLPPPDTGMDNVPMSGGTGNDAGPDHLPSSGQTAPDQESGRSGGRSQKVDGTGEGQSNRRLTGSADKNEREERKMGDANEDRTVGDNAAPLRDVKETLEAGDCPPGEGEGDGDLLEHIREQAEEGDCAEVRDVATQEQQRRAKITREDEETKEAKHEDRIEEVEKKEEPAASDDCQNPLRPLEAMEVETKEEEEVIKEQPRRDETEMETETAVNAPSTFHTRTDLLERLYTAPSAELQPATAMQVDNPNLVSEAKRAVAEKTWQEVSDATQGLARELTEQLRLILEPTMASKLRGDYRTGKRLNMRKVIPYVASHFRKDKIWLRRTKPHGREYRILIAVDDSSSMRSNLCLEMTFKAVAIITSALSMLEVGRLGVCSFGSEVRFLHPLGSDSPLNGAELLSGFQFTQNRTDVSRLLRESVTAFRTLPRRGSISTSAAPAQLLLIVSDGVSSDHILGPAIRNAVRQAREEQLFVVFIIIDSPGRKCPVFNLRRYVSAEEESLLPARLRSADGVGRGRMVSYMELFPFPFYLVLRDINAMPTVLADALRQWFELMASCSPT